MEKEIRVWRPSYLVNIRYWQLVRGKLQCCFEGSTQLQVHRKTFGPKKDEPSGQLRAFEVHTDRLVLLG
jgi:hypothetical protein